jgi:hypothetical protein
MKQLVPFVMLLLIGCGVQEAPVASVDEAIVAGIDPCIEHGGDCVAESACSAGDVRKDLRCTGKRVCCMGDFGAAKSSGPAAATASPPVDGRACSAAGGECIAKSDCPYTIRHPEYSCGTTAVCCIWLP